MKMKRTWMVTAVITALAFLTSCAHIMPKRDSSGRVMEVESTKFMADLAYEVSTVEELDEAGKVKRRITTEKYETRTNADRILDSATKLTGQLVDGASKVFP